MSIGLLKKLGHFRDHRVNNDANKGRMSERAKSKTTLISNVTLFFFICLTAPVTGYD
jgi:hypothetical protein